MSYTFLLEQGEESTAACFSGIVPFAPSNWTPIAARSFSNASGMESSPGSPSGTMSRPLMETPTEAGSISSPAVSLARESHQPENEKGSATHDQGFGLRWPGSFVRFNHDTHSWRTAQCSLLWGSDEFLGTWPRWGSMRDGECSVLTMSEPPIIVSESGYLPTPVKTDSNQTGPRTAYKSLYRTIFDLFGGRVSPEFHEFLMGWPTGSTGLQPLETAKFQQWWQSHFESSTAA
jgi:hypothetical protein